MMNLSLRSLAALAGGILLSVSPAVAQFTYNWTGSSANNALFSGEGYFNWDPMLSGSALSTSSTGSTAHTFVLDGGAAAPAALTPTLYIDVAYANIGQLIIRNTDGLLPDHLIITSYAGTPGGTRAFRFNTPNVTVIELDNTVTGTVSFGYDTTLYGNLGMRLPDSGISTFHVAHPDAVLDLSGLLDGFTSRGGVHAGSVTLEDDRAYLRKTGDGTLDLRTADGQGNRVKGLIVEGGTVIVSTNPQLGWAPAAYMADHVVVNGGTLHMQGFGTNSSETRGFQVGENGGTFHMTDAAHAINGIVSDVPGQAGVLIKSGPTALRLAAENTYSGGTHIVEGRLRYTSDTALGTGKVTIHNGAELAPTISSAWVLSNDIDIVGNSVQFGGDGQSLNLAGTIDLTGEARTFVLANSVNSQGSLANGTLTVAATNNVNALYLNGTNTLTGTTTVERGGLVVNSVLPGDVTVGRSLVNDVEWIGFLGGTGTIGGHAVVHGELRPGADHTGAVGTLAIGGDFTLSESSQAIFEIAAATLHDMIAITGSASFGGLFSVVLLDGFLPELGDSFQLVAAGGGLALGAGFAFDLPSLDGGLEWDTTDFQGSGTLAVVPEPSTYALLALAGLAGFVFLRRRR